MIDWNIQSRAHACQGCEQRFADKQPYHTVLVDHRHEYQRLDLCERCWMEKHGRKSAEQKGFISHWQGVYQVPPAAPPDPIQKETAETVLRKLLEQNDPHYCAASYILAVMLERKRVLKVKEQFRQGGRRIFVYEHPKTGDLFTIPDPDLQLTQLEEVQRQVAQLMEHGLNPAPPAGVVAEPVAESAAAQPSEQPAAD
ncbi:MAG: hypothetical protein EXS29_06615 [Pedosphaera sp.]|nr:hypothetical protein [Pedosphaera sp.]MST00964.1 hypothetical protein [Pedosphaera sp.]